MKFYKETLKNLLDNDPDVEDDEGFTVVETEWIGERRWVDEYQMIFKFEDKFYVTYYETAKHEDGDVRPYEYDPVEIECEEVFPVAVVVTKYVNEKELKKRHEDFEKAKEQIKKGGIVAC